MSGVKSHTRRGRNGKPIHVRGYTRRNKKKGGKKEQRPKGREFEEKVEEKKPKMTPEEIAAEKKRIQDWNEAYKRKEEERKDLGMSKERYSYYVAKKQKEAAKAGVRRKERTSRSRTGPLSQKGSTGILEKIEDTIARFVDKYGGGKKYKRKL